MPTLGVLGTMVWDTIHSRDAGRERPVEEWGGISYALAAADAALPDDWRVLPIIKVGADLRERADRFLAGLQRVATLDGVRTVAEPNNRVELVYQSAGRRCERLTGGVPGWNGEELLPIARACDAVYVNFIAGWELDLATAQALRVVMDGLLYADIHSLMLGIGPDGVRALRPLQSWRDWLRCFDVAQLNEDELAALTDEEGDPWQLAADELGSGLRALLVTLGERGAAWVATREFWAEPRPRGEPATSGLTVAGSPILSGKVPGAPGPPAPDPTGCGDVFGITCLAGLLDGLSLEQAMTRANAAAARNAGFRGASGLSRYLRGGPGLLLAEGS